MLTKTKKYMNFFFPLGQKFKVPVWSAELSKEQRKNVPLTAFVAAFVPSSPLLPHIHSASWPGTETLKNPTLATFISGKLFSSHWVVDGNFKTQPKPILLKTTQRLVFLMSLIQCLHWTVTTSCLSNSGGFPVSGAERISLLESFARGVYSAGFPHQSSSWHALLFCHGVRSIPCDPHRDDLVRRLRELLWILW